MTYSIRPMEGGDGKPIIDLFNHYVENSGAAYPEAKLPYGAFGKCLQAAKHYPTARDILAIGRKHSANREVPHEGAGHLFQSERKHGENRRGDF